MRASQIAQLVSAELEGGADPELTGVAPLDRAGPADLTFLAHPRYLGYVDASGAGAILVARALRERIAFERPLVVVDDVYRALARILPELYPASPSPSGIHATAIMGRGVDIGEGASIGAYAVLGDGVRLGPRAVIGAHCVLGERVEVGPDARLHSHVTLYANVRVGARSILHSGVRAGVDGFGYAFENGAHRKVPQVGRCVIGSDVEIGANTTIDRGSVGSTEIGDGVKIDNLVHIAHNVRIGDHSVIVAQVGVAGSTTIGRFVTLAGQAGIPGHLTIGDGATVAAQAGVFGDVPAGATYSGYPARPHRESLRAQASLARLPELVKRVAELERELKRRTGAE